MNKLDTDYQNLLKDILENGVEKKDRTGTGTISVFGRQIRHKMSDGFPVLTTKKLHWKSVVTELIWFLEGRTDLRWLLERGNTIWVGDTYKNYRSKSKDIDLPKNLYDKLIDDLNRDAMFPIENPSRILTQEEFINKIKTDNEFAKKWGSLGKIYGEQWRRWGLPNYSFEHVEYGVGNDLHVDQISNLINTLKTNPDDRGMIVSAWNVGELNQMVLRPCHYGFQVYTRELSEQERMDLYNKSNWNKDIFPGDVSGWNRLLDSYNIPTRAISLMWSQRSVDTPLGLPFNVASYGLLLEILAKEVNMIPDELIGNLGDCHIYLNQIDGIKEQLTREPYPLPKLNINTEFWLTETGECGIGKLNTNLKGFESDDFILEGYQSHPPIKIPLSN